MATEYGIRNESVAIGKFMEKTGKIVKPSGLFVDLEYGFLGASPDGMYYFAEVSYYLLRQLGINKLLSVINICC